MIWTAMKLMWCHRNVVPRMLVASNWVYPMNNIRFCYAVLGFDDNSLRLLCHLLEHYFHACMYVLPLGMSFNCIHNCNFIVILSLSCHCVTSYMINICIVPLFLFVYHFIIVLFLEFDVYMFITGVFCKKWKKFKLTNQFILDKSLANNPCFSLSCCMQHLAILLPSSAGTTF